MQNIDEFSTYRTAIANALAGLRLANDVVSSEDYGGTESSASKKLRLARMIIEATDIEVQACLFGGLNNIFGGIKTNELRDRVTDQINEQILNAMHVYKTVKPTDNNDDE